MSRSESPLAGRAVLVTRPAEQAEGLANRIAQAGGHPILFPALEIVPPDDVRQLAHALSTLAEYDLLIFISPTAVERAWPFILEHHGGWPAGVALAAVGEGTHRALQRFGARGVLTPELGADSESLLALPGLRQMNGKRVLIVRGEGGRDLLAATLAERGAQVDFAACYRRVRPTTDATSLLAYWRQEGLDAVTVTSREILANLLAMLGEAGQDLLRATPMFVQHERIAESARAQGVATVITTPPGEEGLIAGLLAWYRSAHEQ